jgi:hypothetical protein
VIDLHVANGHNGGGSARPDATLELIRASLSAFSETRYSRTDRLDTATLDTALVNGMGGIRRLRLKKLWFAPSGRPSTASPSFGA